MHTNAREFATAFDNGVDDYFFFGRRCGCGTGCEGEDGVVVFEGPLGMAKGDTSVCWSEYGALALSSSKGAPFLGWSRGVSPTQRQCSRPNIEIEGSYLPRC